MAAGIGLHCGSYYSRRGHSLALPIRRRKYIHDTLTNMLIVDLFGRAYTRLPIPGWHGMLGLDGGDQLVALRGFTLHPLNRKVFDCQRVHKSKKNQTGRVICNPTGFARLPCLLFVGLLYSPLSLVRGCHQTWELTGLVVSISGDSCYCFRWGLGVGGFELPGKSVIPEYDNPGKG